MRALRERWFLLTCVLVAVSALGGAAWSASSALRGWWWTRIAAQPLTTEERASLEACAEVGWRTWIKVLATDPELACGEAWAARALASAADRADPRAWLEATVTTPGSAPGARMRAATALALAGFRTPLEPLFLTEELDERRLEAWLEAAAEDEGLALQLGPRFVALRTTTLADRGELEPGEALPVLRWLSTVDAPAAREAADRALTRLTSVDADLAGRLRDRRRRHLPVGEPAVPERDGLASCAELPCFEARIRVLEALVGDLEEAGSSPDPGEPELPVPAELAEPGSLAAEALTWEVRALRAWLDAAPDRAARLAALLGRPGRGSVMDLGWDGSGTPWAVAALLPLLGDGASEVRADRADTVWVAIGATWTARSCGAPGSAPPSTVFDEPAIRARALLEAAEDPQRAVVLARARTLDPGLPLPPPSGDPVAFRIGAALAPQAGPEGDRGVGTAGPWCR